MSHQTLTSDFKLAFYTALIGDGEETAHQMEMAADKFDENPETKGIANLLRDRAGDLRLTAIRDRDFWQPVD